MRKRAAPANVSINEAMEQWRRLALQPRIIALLLFCLGAIIVPGAMAYDVCADDYADRGVPSCAHEQMFDEAMRLYTALAPANRFSQEIQSFKDTIRAGVGAPDEADPLYDNVGIGGALITITHFWQPDLSIGQPQVQVLDPYPNAFNASQALWNRALGEYVAGNKSEAYRFLGMIAHFLGDQTVPAHANGDTHPENFNDGDPFEEWMSNPLLNKTLLTPSEFASLELQGLITLPDYETIDQLLWLFLNVNQVAGYFASDDDEGDADLNADSRFPYANDYARNSLDIVIAACGGICPTTSDQLQDNDRNTYPYFYDDDDDLDLIRTNSYVPGVRKLAALLSLWEQAIQTPMLTLTVHRMAETGFTDAVACFGGTLGLDDCGRPDLYLGVVMGNRRRSPAPPGALLESDNASHSFRVLDGKPFPATVTRTDANTSIAEDKVIVEQDYHFAQAFKPDAAGNFAPGVDIIDLSMQVRDQDVTAVTSSPYGDDDIALIHPNGSSEVKLEVDLAKCASGVDGGVRVLGHADFACAPSTDESGFSILVGGGRGPDPDDFGGDSGDVDVRFSVSLFEPDVSPPVITCGTADGLWHATDVGIACTAVDEGSGLADPADAAFELRTNVPDGTETANALTESRIVCDAVGNCALAGPIGGNKIDKKAPDIVIVEPQPVEYTHSDTLVLDYTVTDGGSGVATVTPTMNGSSTVAGNGLASGQSILLLVSLPLGEHTFAVDADDQVGNVSPTESVTFSIVVTPESLIEAVNIFEGLGDIDPKLVKSLLAKLNNAAQKFNAGQCTPAANIYNAFINEVQAQTGKKISEFAASILIADAEYLIANC